MSPAPKMSSVKGEDEVARYRELLRRDPHSRVFAPLAEAYRREGRLEEALALALDGVAHHPSYAGGRLALGRVFLDLGRVREAAGQFDVAIAASPGGASAWRLLGEARSRLRDRSAAFEAFARALALDPLDEGARRAVLDIDSLIASSPPAREPAPEDVAKPGELTQPLEAEELSLLLIPEDSESQQPAFLAGRLDVLDIVHSSLAPEAMDDPEPDVRRGAAADTEPDVRGGAAADAEPDADAETERVWEFLDDDGDSEPGMKVREPLTEVADSAAPPPDLRTETLADLYVQQGHVNLARDIYRAILTENPLHLRVKKKLLDLPVPAPAAGKNAAERKIAALSRWLDHARNATDGPGREGRKGGIGDSAGIITTPPKEEGR